MQYQQGEPNPPPLNEITGKKLTDDPFCEFKERFLKGMKKEVKAVKEAAMGRGARVGKAIGHSIKEATPKSKMHKTMAEFKRGSLHSGSKTGPEVTSRKQAVAIGLSQARKAGKK